MRHRLLYLTVALALALVTPGPSESASDYPRYPVQFIINFPPGGPSDTTVRIIHETLQKNLGGTIELVNKPGAGGILGFAYVAKAKPDGYTIVAAMASPLTVAAAFRDVGFSAADFEPVGAYAVDLSAIFAKPDPRWKTMEEMLAYAKANPNKLTYASTGVGSTPNLVMEAIKVLRQVEISPVHFTGTGPVRTAALGGHTALGAAVLGNIRDLVRAGSLVALAISGKERDPELPDVPTLAELGLAEASMDLWAGLWAPKGTPKPIVEKLSAAVEKTAKDASVVKKLKAAGYRVEWLGPAAMQELTQRDYSTTLKIVKELKIDKKAQ